MLAVLLMLAQAAPAAPPKSPTPPFSALVSPTESARYALTHGCLAAVRRKAKLADTPNAFILLVDRKRGIYRMNGAGTVLMSDTPPQVGCYMRVMDGDPERLREMALSLLATEAPTPPLVDSGPGSRDSVGSFRQESHCVTIGGRRMAVLISTSSAPRRPKMQLSLVPNAGDACVGNARP